MEKRAEFIEGLKDNYSEPIFGEVVDGYKEFVQDLGGEFLKFVELYNDCINIAKRNELIGSTKLKARIKDFSSSHTNTDVKLLDDMFGMEVVTATELEKEFFMLFNHLIFKFFNDKKYNKDNGYRAYHCTGDVSVGDYDIQEKVKEILETAMVREYKYAKHEPKYDKDLMQKTFVEIPTRIKDAGTYKLMVQTLAEMVQKVKEANLIKDGLPIIEFHFMTSEVEHEAIRGSSSHSRYKNTNDKLIKEFFNTGRLFRGINAPWKFEVKHGKLELQDFYKTLLENWPFLKDDIIAKRRLGREEIDREANGRFDRLLGVQFPFLRKYVGTEGIKYAEKDRIEQWGALKGIIIANRIDLNENKANSLSAEFLEQMDNLWRTK